MIDLLPEDDLDSVWHTLHFRLHPPPRNPEMERMQRQANDYREKVLNRFKETRRPGTLGSFGGGASYGMQGGRHFGKHGFNYWDEDALVYQSVITYNGQNLEFVQRFLLSPDRTSLLCAMEIASGGHTIHQRRFFDLPSLRCGVTHEPESQGFASHLLL